MRRVRCGHAVCLPDVHLHATSTVMPNGRVARGVPVQGIGLAVNEFHVMRALRIAVASAVLGTCPVVAVPACTTELVHLYEIHCTVQTAGQVGDIDIHCELPVLQLEHHVIVIAILHVHPRAVVCSILRPRDKLEFHAFGRLLDAVAALVARECHSLEGTVGSAACAIRAETWVPRAVVLIAVRVAVLVVDPPPIGVQGDGAVAHRAASCHRALLQWHARAKFHFISPWLLCYHHAKQAEHSGGACEQHCE
mmetsp:Transcript_96590/g.144592  ORF Transcript_96590/g.144592 Transcript_96590/m.144592 type:complete len:251 (-) Transcript_96590:97-849(-)